MSQPPPNVQELTFERCTMQWVPLVVSSFTNLTSLSIQYTPGLYDLPPWLAALTGRLQCVALPRHFLPIGVHQLSFTSCCHDLPRRSEKPGVLSCATVHTATTSTSFLTSWITSPACKAWWVPNAHRTPQTLVTCANLLAH